MTYEFLLTSLIIVLLPGTGVIYTLAIGLGRGFTASLFAAFGCTMGIVPHLIASVLGLAALLHASALAFQVIKFAGVAYLLYLAWGMLRSGGALDVKPRRDGRSLQRIVVDAVAINVLNPKLSVFFLAFLPQFVPVSSGNPTAAMIALALVFMLMTFAIFIIYGALASAMRDYVISRPLVMKWVRRSFAGAFGLMSLRLALTER